jgi:hypothetical protein
MFPGPDTRCVGKMMIIDGNLDANSKICAFDNELGDGTSEEAPKIQNLPGLDVLIGFAPIWIYPLNLKPVSQVKGPIITHAGARPANRDAVDLRIVDKVI